MKLGHIMSRSLCIYDSQVTERVQGGVGSLKGSLGKTQYVVLLGAVQNTTCSVSPIYGAWTISIT